MPNLVCNVLTFDGKPGEVESLIAIVRSPGRVFDFNRIVPIPEGCEDKCLWARKAWGTKANAYSSEFRQDGSICFITPWSAPLALIQRLSEKFPDISLTLRWADEVLGQNTGEVTFRDGCESDWFYPENDSDAAEIYERCWNQKCDNGGKENGEQ